MLKTLRSPLDSKEIKPVNPKGNQPWIFIGNPYAEAEVLNTFEYFEVLNTFLMRRADSLEKTLMLGKTEGRMRRGWQRMRQLDGITDPMDMSLSKLQEMVKDGVAESDTTEWLNSNNKCSHDHIGRDQSGKAVTHSGLPHDGHSCLVHSEWAKEMRLHQNLGSKIRSQLLYLSGMCWRLRKLLFCWFLMCSGALGKIRNAQLLSLSHFSPLLPQIKC